MMTFKVIHNKGYNDTFVSGVTYVPSVLCTKHTIILYNKDSTKGIALDERNPIKFILKLFGYSHYLTV